MWRDARTCVPARDCTCRTPFGKIIPPGGVEESEGACEVCQCLDNEYICDNSRCNYAWSTPAVDVSKNLTVVTTPKPRPPGPTKTPTSCSGWSDWINEYQKPAWGDYESKTPEQLNQMGFCLHGKIADIECRDVKNNELWTESRDKDLVCSLKKGFSCMPARQGKGRRCQDYKIRYFCDCSGGDQEIDSTTTPAPTTSIMIWTTTRIRPRTDVCLDEDLMPMLADQRAVPDSAFIATTSKSGAFGPSSARFPDPARSKKLPNDGKKGVSWVAGKRDMFQHIQVDLGAPSWIYGFEVSGNPAVNEYVTSLFVLYSEDNQRFSYVPNRKGKFNFSPCLDLVKSKVFLFFKQEDPSYSEDHWNMTAVKRICSMDPSKLVTSVSSRKLGSMPSLCDSISLDATPLVITFTLLRHRRRWKTCATTRWDSRTA